MLHFVPISLKSLRLIGSPHFFSDKIVKTCDGFGLTSQIDLVQPPFDPPSMVSSDEVKKLTSNSPSKSRQLDLWTTFLVKDCHDILLPSVTKLVN